MLRHLSVRDYALFERLELELGAGFVAITGETGAGKSLVLGAIGLLRGARAVAESVRTGADKALVQGLFELGEAHRARVNGILDEAGLPTDDDAVLVRRVVSRSGANRVYINDGLATVALLQRVTPPLLEVVGQHEALTLTRSETQRSWIDRFAGHHGALDTMREAFGARERARARLIELQRASDERVERLRVARFQRDELAMLEPREGEYATLEGQLHRVRNRERVRASIDAAREALIDGDDSATDLVGRAVDALGRSGDDGLAGLSERLDAALIAIDDVGRELSRFADSVDDDVDIDTLESRHQAIRTAMRTHRVADDAALLKRLEALREECATLDDLDSTIAEAALAEEQAGRAAVEAADKLDVLRRDAANGFFEEALPILRSLNLPHARLSLLEPGELRTLTKDGWSPVEIGFSANPGEPLQAIAKVASGGELSRLLLALKTSSMRADPVGTYVFDEVDNGIGGEAAEVVATLLTRLGAQRQVLCVTHLPALAGRATTHLHVSKDVRDGRTRSLVEKLGRAERIDEVARMIGGADAGEGARAHAADLVERAPRG